MSAKYARRQSRKPPLRLLQQHSALRAAAQVGGSLYNQAQQRTGGQRRVAARRLCQRWRVVPPPPLICCVGQTKHASERPRIRVPQRRLVARAIDASKRARDLLEHFGRIFYGDLGQACLRALGLK